MKTKCIGNYARVVKAADGKLTASASTETVDRDGEIILASAFSQDLDVYRSNPVILAAHIHRASDGSPTIIGSATRVEVEKDGLVFDMSFADTPLADQWRSLYEAGHAKAFSVGFIPLDGEFREVKSGPQCDRRRSRRDAGETEMITVYVHTRVELLEISAVPVPANPEALARDVDNEDLERRIDERVRRVLKEMYIERIQALFK